MELILIVVAIVWIYCSFVFIKDNIIKFKSKKQSLGDLLLALFFGIAYIVGGIFLIFAIASTLHTWLPSGWQ